MSGFGDDERLYQEFEERGGDPPAPVPFIRRGDDETIKLEGDFPVTGTRKRIETTTECDSVRSYEIPGPTVYTFGDYPGKFVALEDFEDLEKYLGAVKEVIDSCVETLEIVTTGGA